MVVVVTGELQRGGLRYNSHFTGTQTQHTPGSYRHRPGWIHPAQHAVKTPENLYSELEVFRQEAMFGSGLVGFCLLVLALGFLGRPGLAHNGKMHSESLQETVVPEPAQCLVSRIYNLIRPAESKDDRSCWQDCFAKTDCHMAVVTKRISAAQQCLLVNCLNHGNHSLPRDPSAEITVYPKSTIDDELRANLMKHAHGAVDERLRCYERGCQSESHRFFYNTTSSRCERLFGGCGSNMKTFKTLKSCATLCHKKVRCYLPVEYGQTPPVGHLPFGPDNVSSTNADTTGKPKDTTVNFYFYNVSSGSCEGFHFRGSASNGNIFRTVQECESLCGDVKDRCFDFMKYSSYQSESPRFFYNSTSYRCERLFGSCGSNKNVFETLESCEALCNEKFRCNRLVDYGENPPNRFGNHTDIRGKPNDPTVNFYFYNVSSGSCEGFHFRGSLSNGNLFQTVKECESLCGVKAAVTSPPAEDPGTTAAVPTKWRAAATSSPAVVSAAVTSPPAEDPGTTAAVPTKWRDIVIGVVVGIAVLLVCVLCVVCRKKSTNRSRYRPVGSHPDEQPLMGDDVAMTSVGGDGAVDMTRTFGVGDLGLDSHCNTSTNVSLRKTLNY